MDEVKQHPCSCELCQRNWHLGESGDTFIEAPQDLAKAHEAKLAREGIEFAPLPEVALN